MAEKTTSRGIRLPDRLWEAAGAAAAAEGRSLGGWVSQALRDALSATTAHLADKEERQAERDRILSLLKGDYRG